MKINNKKVKTNGLFAYDGCHKIYILESEQDRQAAIDNGYTILLMEELEETYNTSCPLRFINNWKLDTTYVSQCETAEFSNEAEDKNKKLYLCFYYKGKHQCSYTFADTFGGEKMATLELIAQENNCDITDIETRFEWR